MEEQLSCNVSIHEESTEDGKTTFVVDCLELGISDFGDTKEEAFHNLRNAIDLYLEEAPEKKKLMM